MKITIEFDYDSATLDIEDDEKAERVTMTSTRTGFMLLRGASADLEGTPASVIVNNLVGTIGTFFYVREELSKRSLFDCVSEEKLKEIEGLLKRKHSDYMSSIGEEGVDVNLEDSE